MIGFVWHVPTVAQCAQTSQCPHYCLFKTYFVIFVSAPALLLLMVPRGHGAWTHALCHPEQKTVPNIKFNFQFKIIKNENKGLMPSVVAGISCILSILSKLHIQTEDISEEIQRQSLNFLYRKSETILWSGRK